MLQVTDEGARFFAAQFTWSLLSAGAPLISSFKSGPRKVLLVTCGNGYAMIWTLRYPSLSLMSMTGTSSVVFLILGAPREKKNKNKIKTIHPPAKLNYFFFIFRDGVAVTL